MPTRFIELAGEINVAMPRYVVGKLEEALDRRLSKSLGTSRILILGLAYKKNVSDIRESPSLKLIELIEKRGARVDYHDPFVPEIPRDARARRLFGRESVGARCRRHIRYDAVVIATDHDRIDYRLVCENTPLVIDTRNAAHGGDRR